MIYYKPISDPMLEYCSFDPYEQNSVKFQQNLYPFIQENAFEKVVYEMATLLYRPMLPVQQQHYYWINLPEIIASYS